MDDFFSTIQPILEKVMPNYEIICVNDGSKDQTLSLLQSFRQKNSRIKLIDLSRNFGKELALTAGLYNAIGDAVIPMDVDLQDPPELIPIMLEKWREGYDVVLAVRHQRTTDKLFKRVTAAGFYRIFRLVTDTDIPLDAGDFRLMDRRVIDALKLMPERNRFMKGLFAWLGFRQTRIYFSRPNRVAGNTKWSIWKLWNFALDGIFSFSIMPLRIWTYCGVLIFVFSLSYLCFIVSQAFFFGNPVPGYPSLLSIILFFNGLIMIGLGILGEYVGRIFIESKQRPLYLIRSVEGLEKIYHNGESLND